MLKETVEVVRKGDDSGNHMILRFRLPSGIEICGLPTENAYGGGWDLGPTWNYLVLDEKPFLVDTGNVGMGQTLLDMMNRVGLSGEGLDSILITHGHEDHDGALAEMVKLIGVTVKAHIVYDRLIRYYPGEGPPDFRERLPAICWRCFMPESYVSENCLEQQKTRSTVNVEPLLDGNLGLGNAVDIYHVPGHSPDSIAIIIGKEAILVGDTVLPGITPWPTQEAFFSPVKEILSPHYDSAEEIFGLRAYIRSLKKLKEIGRKYGELMVLPSHRLFYNNQWNEIFLEKRIHELIEYHIQRCADMLKIIEKEPKTVKEIALKYFDESLLKGYGILMAENEIISHCELLEASEDAHAAEDQKYVSSGNMNFETFIRSL